MSTKNGLKRKVKSVNWQIIEFRLTRRHEGILRSRRGVPGLNLQTERPHTAQPRELFR